jgi:hypothetical protein
MTRRGGKFLQYGTIADCYTEMGDFEHAAVNYDK